MLERERVDLKLPSGRKSTAKERLYGQIISSVDNNQYMVAFSDGKETQMTSRMLKKATPQEVASYHEGIESLMGKKGDGRPHHCHNEANSANVGNLFTSKSPSTRLSTLRMETNDIDQMVTDVNHSFDHNQNVFTDKLDFNCDSNSSTLPPNSNNNILSPNDTIRSNNNASSSLDIEKKYNIVSTNTNDSIS